jgi:DNA-cytosine methyltransferase
MDRQERQKAYEKKLPDSKQIYVVDFFSGCGGMSWGFANTRQSHLSYRLLGGIDKDEKSLSTYEKNVGAPGVEQDIREIAEDPEMLPDVLPEFDSEEHRPLIFIGCAPCQGFSPHRKKDNRDDPRNNLLIAFAQICAYYEPEVLLMENVPQILSGRYEEYYDAASEVLSKAGYSLTEEKLNLNLYGVPQARKRAFVIGSQSDRIEVPDPIFSKDAAPTVRDAISHLEPIKSGETDPNDPMHKAPNHTDRILKRIKKTPPDGGDRRSLSEDEQLDCHSSLDNSESSGFTDVYGRLRWDKPSVTITAKSSTPSCGRFLHPEQHRNISIREAAILQAFPQSYEFDGPFLHRYRQIGEAVPPLFARFLAWEILDYFRSPDPVPEVIESPKPKDLEEQKHREGRLEVIDLFSGAGGLSLGFELAGYDTALAVDNDEDSVSTYNKNLSGRAVQKDVGDEGIGEILADAPEGERFVLAGGPPCQGFSQQRRGEDEDPRNNLVLRFAELATSLPVSPAAVVLENVTYLDSPRGRKVLQEYRSTLEKAGYQIFRHDLNSANFGVPQLRDRIFVVAVEKEIAQNYQGPRPITPKRWKTVGEAFAGLPEFRTQTEREPTLPFLTNHEASNESDLNKRRIAFVDMGKGRLWIPPHLQLDCHKGYDGHKDVYGRLDWFSQARTVTGGFDSFTRGEYGHPFFHRSITPREGARLQGFPDWFEFVGNRASLRSQIGNAVPPPVAYSVAQAIKDSISRRAFIDNGQKEELSREEAGFDSEEVVEA